MLYLVIEYGWLLIISFGKRRFLQEVWELHLCHTPSLNRTLPPLYQTSMYFAAVVVFHMHHICYVVMQEYLL